MYRTWHGRNAGKRLRLDDARLGEIEEFLGLGEDALLKAQYKRAKSLGLADRAQQKEIDIREMFLDANGGMFNFETFAHMRQPDEYAAHTLKIWKQATPLPPTLPPALAVRLYAEPPLAPPPHCSLDAEPPLTPPRPLLIRRTQAR